jgi:hypothetical protein
VLQTLSFWVPSQLQATWILKYIEHDIIPQKWSWSFKSSGYCDMSLSEKFQTFQRIFCLQQIRNFPLSDTASHLTRPERYETQMLEPP